MTGSIPDEQIDVLLLSPTDRNYILSLSAQFPTSIVSMTHKLVGGSLTATLWIDSIEVGGIEAVSVTTSEVTEGATGANDIAVGQELSITIAGATGSAESLSLSIKTERV
jgi:hypothetical protein